MKTNELRIGNIIKASKTTCLWREGTIVIDKSYFGKILDYGIDTLEPIPITEEWWQVIGEDEKILADKVGFVIFKNGYAYQFVYDDYPYIHQLQNLYHALTGEELQWT